MYLQDISGLTNYIIIFVCIALGIKVTTKFIKFIMFMAVVVLVVKVLLDKGVIYAN